jgi:hypothetical protein
MPFCLKFFASTTINEREHQAIKLADHTHVHKKVHDHYFNSGQLALANRLDDSRIKRNDADYDTALTITPMDSGDALKLARKILQGLGVTLT